MNGKQFFSFSGMFGTAAHFFDTPTSNLTLNFISHLCSFQLHGVKKSKASKQEVAGLILTKSEQLNLCAPEQDTYTVTSTLNLLTVYCNIR